MDTSSHNTVILDGKAYDPYSGEFPEYVNKHIRRFCESNVYNQNDYYEDCRYRDTDKNIYCVLGSSGESDPFSEDGEYIGDYHTMHILNYLEPGKDPVPLITWFRQIDSGHIDGPIRYCYPNGKLAAIENYRLTLSDNSSEMLKEQSIWFSPNGEQISQSEFDAIFYQLLKKFDLNECRFAPRHDYYNALAEQFIIYNEVYQDVSLLTSFREGISHLSDGALEILDDKIRKRNKGILSADELDANIRQYVYGITDHEKLAAQVAQKFFEYISKHVIDREHCEITELKSDGIRFCKYGNFQYELHGCYEISSQYKYVEHWQDGLKVSAGFMTSNSYGEFQVGPSISFYPNGEIYRVAHYGYAGYFDTDLSDVRYFDKNGRLSSFEICHKQFQQQWTDVRNKAIQAKEKKDNFNKKRICKIYKRLCSKESSNLFSGIKRRKK